MAHSKRSRPAGTGTMIKPIFDCFIPDTPNRVVYILKDSGLKVLRAANSIMAMRVIGQYREEFLDFKVFKQLQREMARTRQASIEEGRRIRANLRRQH